MRGTLGNLFHFTTPKIQFSFVTALGPKEGTLKVLLKRLTEMYVVGAWRRVFLCVIKRCYAVPSEYLHNHDSLTTVVTIYIGWEH